MSYSLDMYSTKQSTPPFHHAIAQINADGGLPATFSARGCHDDGFKQSFPNKTPERFNETPRYFDETPGYFNEKPEDTKEKV
jgi:hypothetical protein